MDHLVSVLEKQKAVMSLCLDSHEMVALIILYMYSIILLDFICRMQHVLKLVTS